MALTVKQKLDIDRMNEASARAGGISSMLGANKLMATIEYSDMTDVTTTGTFEFTEDIPIGAIVLAVVLEPAVVGFAGDTSATITVGDGSTADRYMTGTPDVFSDIAGGVGLGAVSGTAYHAAAATPTVVVTVATNYTAVSAGTLVVAIYYLM